MFKSLKSSHLSCDSKFPRDCTEVSSVSPGLSAREVTRGSHLLLADGSLVLNLHASAIANKISRRQVTETSSRVPSTIFRTNRQVRPFIILP